MNTDYSNLRLRDSINTYQELIDYAIELGHEVIAITEHETISNAVKVEKYYNEIKKEYPDFKVILGNEIYLCRDGLNADNFEKGTDKYYHFILLAKDAIGHRQIREISTRAWKRSWMNGKMRRVPTYYQDLIDIIGANPGHVIGSTACFLPGQKVRTRLGEKNIEDIVETDEILTKDGKWEKINFPTNRLYKGQGQILNFSKEPKPIYCTANHQFLVYEPNEKTLSWIEAENLKKNDKCLEPLIPIEYTYNTELYISQFENIKKYRKHSQGKNYSKNIFRLPDKIQITNNLMRLFGLWLADGHISLHQEYSKYNIGFTFSDQEFKIFYNSFVKQGLQDLGLSGQDYSIRYRPENHRVDLEINKVEICLLFEDIFGISHANNKYIPQRLKHISYELDVELFYGYFLGDGYFRYRNSYGGEMVAASISYQLIKDFEQLGLAINLSGSITISQKHNDKNKVQHQESYYLTYANAFLGKNLSKTKIFTHEKLVEIFKLGANKKGAYADIIQINGIKYRIKKVKSNEDFMINETVYCLNTNSHNFVLNNIIVHNCLGGFLPTKLLQWKETSDEVFYNKILSWLKNMQSIFGKEDFYLEMQPSDNPEQIFVNNELKQISKKLDIKYIITTDSHYCKKSDRSIHKAFTTSQEGDREVDEFYATTYMMDTQELESYFSYFTKEELQQAYQTIKEIKEKCEDYSLLKPLKIPRLKWKEQNPITDFELKNYISLIPELEKFVNSESYADNYLVKAIINGIKKHSDLQNKEAYDAINTCLDMTWISSEVNKAEWSAYFLNLQQNLEVCWDAGTIVGPGRGSGVGFILLYTLDITQINPLREKTKTQPWRFLNPARVSVLDVDVDIEGTRREAVLQALRNFYGEDRVSNVATFGTEKSKSAIQTSARGLGLDNDTALYISSLIPADRGQVRTLKQCYYGDEENNLAPVALFVKEMNNNPELWTVAQKIEGLICRIGEHAGGVIFVDEDFTNSTALMRAPNGDLITQFDLHDDEAVSQLFIRLINA